MIRIDLSEIELISKALLNIPESSYADALDGMRKLYTGRGITDAEFDELLRQLQEKAASTPVHDYAFVLHVLGLLYGKKRKHPLRYAKVLKRLCQLS